MNRIEKDRRPQRPQELLADARRAQKYLHRALTEYSDGDADAFKPMTACLRQLIGNGKGDNLLQRLCLEFDLVPPVVRLEPPPPTSPEADGSGLALCVGSMPVFEDAERGAEISSVDVRDRVVVRLYTGPDRGEWTWMELVKLAANELGGVHSAKSISRVIDLLEGMEVSGVPFPQDHVVRLAAQMSTAAATVLQEVGAVEDVPEYIFQHYYATLEVMTDDHVPDAARARLQDPEGWSELGIKNKHRR